MSSDARLVSAVETALFSELRIDDLEVAVSAHDGTVRLRGTVGSPGAKLAAGRAARRVPGVRHVDNELEVRLLVGSRKDDAELRAAVLRALARASVPPTVDATVDNAFVTLTGTVASPRERSEVEAIVRSVAGVDGVDDRVVASSS